MNLMVVIGPGAAPLLGGVLATVFGWRSIFYVLTLLGVAQPDLRPVAAAREPRRPRAPPRSSALARNYGRLLTSPAFLGFAIGGGCATTSMYAFISVSPFIFTHQLGRPDYEAGIYPAILVAGRLARQHARPPG